MPRVLAAGRDARRRDRIDVSEMAIGSVYETAEPRACGRRRRDAAFVETRPLGTPVPPARSSRGYATSPNSMPKTGATPDSVSDPIYLVNRPIVATSAFSEPRSARRAQDQVVASFFTRITRDARGVIPAASQGRCERSQDGTTSCVHRTKRNDVMRSIVLPLVPGHIGSDRFTRQRGGDGWT